ncbi:MAG: HAD family hydrolase [Methanocalculus sp. MSAO_Arc2]|uniref:cation-translocating P-type ATPase n=1 Tax=Methanocalculus sp. MSAO_Arc2 TaxID=2293855 RepID=UPI000FF59B60|nr:MAG: HAD family hydrolase [Methanocalculus sp. MSAO_Arc2]
MASEGDMDKSPDRTWHAMGIAEIRRHLQVESDGLAKTDVESRRLDYGKNILPGRKPTSTIRIILRQFASPLIYILVVAGIVKAVAEDWTDAIFIFLVIGLNSVIGSIQELKAERNAAALQEMLTIYTRVKREGYEEKIPAEDLVPGDIVYLEAGSRVPADVRIISSSSLAIDESLLTGESVAAKKETHTLPEDTPVADRSNMGFAGTTVMSGRGLGIVTSTGTRTEIGKIALSVTTAEVGKTPLLIRMEQFARNISIAVLFACVVLAAVIIYQGEPPTEVFFLAVALAVAAIPEGLPVALTVALAVATTRMAERHVIVRQLSAVESLGSCTVIASDKTGTLTVNQQTAKILILPDGQEFAVSGEGYSGEGEILDDTGEPAADLGALHNLIRAGIICNEGNLSKRDGQWFSSGDAMDIALLALGYKAGIDPSKTQAAHAILAEIPFSSDNRFATVWYQDGEERYIAVKGALEVILPGCRTMLTSEGRAEIDTHAIEEQMNSLTTRGYRVLAIAGGKSDPEEVKGGPPPDLELYGLIGFIDPVRPEVYDAVMECYEAGVDVKMITGDHPRTALAIAQQLGIAEDEEDLITGRELVAAGSPTSPEFASLVDRKHVFARVSPEEKLHIVNALKAAGHFVAVTGDGVNDAPALRSANMGVAMGSGTDVAKDTSAMIITDDSFSSIVAGIKEGRFAYDNVRKVIFLLVSTGWAEVFLFITAIFIIGLPIPLVAAQLLWLNVVTNGIKGVVLSFEPGEPHTMKRPPRDPDEKMFDRVMVRQIAVAGTTMGTVAFLFWFWLQQAGYSTEEARNLLILLVVMLENFHTLNCRSEYKSFFSIPIFSNIYLLLGIVAAQVIHIAAMYTPFFQEALGIAPVSLNAWIGVTLLSLSVLVVVELYKYIINRMGMVPEEARTLKTHVP